MQENIITVEHVYKTFKNTTVLHDVSISFARGKIHGIIGRNGSGKTVLFKCICGFMPITSGTISVRGKRVGKDVDIPKNLGVIIESPGFLPNYSAYANLKFLAELHHVIGKEKSEKPFVLSVSIQTIKNMSANILWVCDSVWDLRRLSWKIRTFSFWTSR